MVVMVGVDVHKSTHTAVAVDEVGRQLDLRTVRATEAGHRQLLRWARRVAEERGAAELEVAVEDCRHVSTRLERDLLSAGVTVIRVPPKLMAGARASARTRGKSDPIDALAIARAALREPDLPRAEHSHDSRRLKLLVDHREDLVQTRTRLQNRLRWRLHELDPALDPTPRSLGVLKQVAVLRERVLHLSGLSVEAELVRRLSLETLEDIQALNERVNALEAEITCLVREQAPQLLDLPGCGALTAAKIVGETANPTRFRSEACFAMHAGAAPIPVASGKTTGRVRLARGGNRQLNAALHRIAVTQIRLNGPGRLYYQRRRSQGDTTMEALRALKRRLARVVFKLLSTPANPTIQGAPAALPAAA
jgi:transposase